MIRERPHIISKVNWETSMTDRKKSMFLQDSISSWSRHVMGRHLNHIFNQSCQADQHLIINSLCLNLGTIDLNQLENELNARLPLALHTALQDLIIQSAEDGSQVFLMHSNMDHLRMLGQFLKHGVLSWRYKMSNGSVNRILSYQLAHNKSNVKHLLKDLSQYKIVRRRMVLQLSKENRSSILELLQPHSYKRIDQLITNLIYLHKSSGFDIPDTETIDKQVWEFVLEFIDAKRGTLFNEIRFLDEITQKLASYYHIRWPQYMDVLHRNLKAEPKGPKTSENFKRTFSALRKNKARPWIASDYDNRLIETHWVWFEEYLKRPSVVSNEEQLFNLDELVFNLYHQNETRFRNLVGAVVNSSKLWTTIITGLSESSLEIMFSVINNNVNPDYVQSVTFLEKLVQNMEYPFKGKNVRDLAISYILEQDQNTISIDDFYLFTISQLEEELKLDKLALLEQLLFLDVPVAFKSDQTIKFRSVLKAIYGSYSTHELIADSEKGIESLIFNLIYFDHEEEQAVLRFEMGVRQLRRELLKQPDYSLDQLIHFKDKAHMLKLLPRLINSEIAQTIISAQDSDLVTLVYALQQQLNHLVKIKKHHTIAAYLEQQFAILSLKIFIEQPGLSISSFLVEIIKRVVKIIKIEQESPKVEFFDSLFDFKAINHLPITSEEFSKSKAEGIELIRLAPIDFIIRVLLPSGDAQKQAAQMLLRNVHKSPPDHVRHLLYSSQGKLIEDYLFHGQSKSVLELIESRWPKPDGATESDFFKLIWISLIDYPQHEGNLDRFIQAVERVLNFKDFKGAPLKDRASNAVIHLGKDSAQMLLRNVHKLPPDNARQLLYSSQGKLIVDHLFHGQSKSFLELIESLWSKLDGVNANDFFRSIWISLIDFPQHEGNLNRFIQAVERALNFKGTPLKDRASNTVLHHDKDSGQMLLRNVQLPPDNARQLLYSSQGKLIVDHLFHRQSKSFFELIEYLWSKLDGVTENDFFRSIWISLIDFPQHEGNLNRFIQAVEKALVFGYGSLKDKSTNEVIHQGKNPLQEPEEIISTGISTKDYFKNLDSVETLELLKTLWRSNPEFVIELVDSSKLDSKILRSLSNVMEYDEFAQIFIAESIGPAKESIEKISLAGQLYKLLSQLSEESVSKELKALFWNYHYDVLSSHTEASDDFVEPLIQTGIQQFAETSGLTISEIILDIGTYSLEITEELKKALVSKDQSFEALEVNTSSTLPSDILLKCYQMGMLDDLCLHLIEHQLVPSWYDTQSSATPTEVIIELILHYPHVYRRIILSLGLTHNRLSGLEKLIDMERLVTLVGKLESKHVFLLKKISELHRAFKSISFGSPSSVELQSIVYALVMKAWLQYVDFKKLDFFRL